MTTEHFEKDHGFKAISERDPEGVVRVLAGVPWDVPLEVAPVEREISLRYQVDHACRVTIGGVTELYHFEAESNFATAAADVALERSVALGLSNRLRMKPILVLYNPNRPALGFDPRRRIDMGHVVIEATFVVARLFEISPDQILARDRIHMMPMVIAMKSTSEQIREASLRIETVERDRGAGTGAPEAAPGDVHVRDDTLQ